MFTSSARRRRDQRYRRHRHALMGIATLALIGTAVLLIQVGAQPGTRKIASKTRAIPAHPAEHASRRPQSGTRNSPADAGQGLSWVNFHGIELPVSPHDGPRDTSHGLASGFSDTPRGALLAAINIGVRTAALLGPAIYSPTISHQVTGLDAAALLAADTSNYKGLRAAVHVQAGQAAGRGYAAEAAYRFVSWTPTDATVDVVSEGPGNNGSTVLAVTRIEVVWQRGDWRVVAPPGGDWASSASSVSSLTGYIAFPSEG
jgi:hypothetical protein